MNEKEHLIITENEDLLFHWTIIIVATNWKEKQTATLLELVADLFVTMMQGLCVCQFLAE